VHFIYIVIAYCHAVYVSVSRLGDARFPCGLQTATRGLVATVQSQANRRVLKGKQPCSAMCVPWGTLQVCVKFINYFKNLGRIPQEFRGRSHGRNRTLGGSLESPGELLLAMQSTFT